MSHSRLKTFSQAQVKQVLQSKKVSVAKLNKLKVQRNICKSKYMKTKLITVKFEAHPAPEHALENKINKL